MLLLLLVMGLSRGADRKRSKAPRPPSSVSRQPKSPGRTTHAGRLPNRSPAASQVGKANKQRHVMTSAHGRTALEDKCASQAGSGTSREVIALLLLPPPAGPDGRHGDQGVPLPRLTFGL